MVVVAVVVTIDVEVLVVVIPPEVTVVVVVIAVEIVEVIVIVVSSSGVVEIPINENNATPMIAPIIKPAPNCIPLIFIFDMVVIHSYHIYRLMSLQFGMDKKN